MKLLRNKIKEWYDLVSGRAQNRAFIEAFERQIEADRARLGIPNDLAGYQTKFKHNLVGNWLTNNSEFLYFGPVPTTQWQFFEDGTAWEMNSSGMTGNRRTRYQWRELEYFAIELLELETEMDEEDKGEWKQEEYEEEDEDEPSTWFRRSYDFKVEGERIVLFETPENEDFKFGMASECLVFQGDHSKEKREEN